MFLCKDCKWQGRASWWHPEPTRCMNIQARRKPSTDPVNGHIDWRSQEYCDVMRMNINEWCGREGRLWEQKQCREPWSVLSAVKTFLNRIRNMIRT